MKRIKLLILMGCLIFISNVKAQMGNNKFWGFSYEYNADMTASVKIWNNDTIYAGTINTDGYGVPPYYASDYNSNHVFIPDHVIYNGQNYTVTAIKRGAKNLGWSPTRYDVNAFPIACDSNFYVYIPKTIQSIEDSVFCGRGSVKEVYSPLISGKFWFYFEGLTQAEIAQKFGYVNYKFKWFIQSSAPYMLSWFDTWANVVRFTDNQDLTIDTPSDGSNGEISVILDNNVVTGITLPYWINKITTNNFRSATDAVYIDSDFNLSYSVDANTGEARSGNIVLTDNYGVTKTITINQAAGSNTGIENVNVPNVKYHIENGVIYFEEAVKNVKLYDLSGKLVSTNNNTNVLNVGNNLKGVYVLRYDNASVKVML